MRPVLPLFPALLVLGGCAANETAPSLAIRPAERLPIAAPDPVREAGAAADPALAGRIVPVIAAVDAGAAAFERARGEAAAAVTRAQGAAAGSDRWLAAQQVLSTLESARAPIRDAAAALDALRQEPANAASGNRAAIEAAAARVDAIEAAQAAAVAALAGALPD